MSRAVSPAFATETARATDAPLWALVGLLLVSLVPVLTSPVIPAIDLYNHLARYFVLSRIDGDSFLAANYAANWSLLPNIGMDVIGTALMRVFDCAVTPKLVVALIVIVQFTGVLALNKQLTGRISLVSALLSAILVYSYILTWGFANFLLGLGLMLWGAAIWLALRRRLLVACLAGCAVALVIYLVHGVAFALYGLLLGALEIGRFLTAPQRDVRKLGLAMAALATQAVIPALLFHFSATAKADGGLTNADESIQRLAAQNGLGERLWELAGYRLATIFRVAESHSVWVDAVSAAAIVVALALLWTRGGLRVARIAWPAIALGVLLVVVIPPTLFGVGYISDRMPLFLALVAAASLSSDLKPLPAHRIGLAVLAGLCLLRVAYTEFDWRRYDSDMQDFRRVASALPPQSVVAYIDVANADRLDGAPRCEMYGPLLTLTYRQATPLFAYGTQQPLNLVGRLRDAGRGLPSMTAPPSRSAAARARLDAMSRTDGFQYAVVCGLRAVSPLPANASVLAESGRFALVGWREPRPGV